MKHEKIFKRDNITIKVKVTLLASFCDSPSWSFEVEWRGKGKRNWNRTIDHDNYKWRKLGPKERREEDHRRALTVATKDEVREVIEEAMEIVKPDYEKLLNPPNHME